MAVDLHLHSTCSDGSDTPDQLVGRAAAAGLTAMALTDHDTIEGLEAAQESAEAAGIGFIPGIELSLEWPEGTMHLLVYHLGPGPGPLQDQLDRLRTARSGRNEAIVERLNAMGVAIGYDDVVAQSGGGVVGRPHIAAVLVEMGHADSTADAFERWLGKGRPAYVPRTRLEPAEALALARESGGVPVLAHPHTLGVPEQGYTDTFRSLADLGLGGIEAWYAEYRPEMRAHIAGLAEDLGLVATGGSDHHGTYKPHLDVGVGRGDLHVPDEVVAQLEAVRP